MADKAGGQTYLRAKKEGPKALWGIVVVSGAFVPSIPAIGRPEEGCRKIAGPRPALA